MITQPVVSSTPELSAPSGVHSYSKMKHVSRSAWRVLDILQRVSNHRGPAECSWRRAYQKNISALLHFVSGHPFSDKCLFSSRLTCCNGFVTLAAYTESKVCQQSCVWFHKTLWWCHGIAIVSDGNGIMFFVYCGTEGLWYAFTWYSMYF